MAILNLRDIELYVDVLDQGDGHTMIATVEYTYAKACRGAYEHGMQVSPDDPEEAEICNVWATDRHGRKLDISGLLSDEQLDSIADEILTAREPA